MRALVVANGDDPRLTHAHLRDVDLVVAVDGGLRHLTSAGFTPSILVGDLDSLVAADVTAAENAEVEVIRHPADKSQTDLELALALTVERGATEIVACGVSGGRVDHLFANIGVLAQPTLASVAVSIVEPDFRAWIVHDRLELPLAPGQTVSVLAVGGPATVSVWGTRWELAGHQLDPYVGLGVSNEVVDEQPGVAVAAGVALVLSPVS